MQAPSTVRPGSDNHRKAVVAFGAAVSALAVSHAPAAEASIVDLTPTVGSVTITYKGGFGGGGGSVVSLGAAGSFFQYNDFVGKSLAGTNYGLAFRFAQQSSILSAAMSFAPFLNVSKAAAGTAFLGFKNSSSQIGWLKVNWGGPGGSVHYLAGAYNDQLRGSIHVGDTSDVPEPATTSLVALGLLAAGARGVRRLREKRRQEVATDERPASDA
jgi:PEP-CTERM motif